jgi:hypothetical protein
MTTHTSGQPTPPHVASGGRPRLAESMLSAGRLTELRDAAARLGASPVVGLTDLRCLEDLIGRLGTLITQAGGTPPPVSTSLQETGLRYLDRLSLARLREIRSLAGKLHGSLAVTPGEKARLARIITRTDDALTIRHEIEQYWAERGEPMPAHLTH